MDDSASIIDEVFLAKFRQSAKLFRQQVMSDITIQVSAIRHDAGTVVTRHVHRHGQLLIVQQGTLGITSEEGWWIGPPGVAVWVPPEVAHRADYSESSSIVNVILDGAAVASLPPTCTSLIVSELLIALALEAVRLAKDNATASEAHDLIARLIALEIRQRRHASSFFLPHGRDRRLQQATLLMRASPGSHMTLDELARSTHTSVRTLARLFVKETGMPFTGWRDHLRILSAVDRLARKQSITQVALALGYKSASSFTTLFTRVVGMPPKRYMRHLLEQEQRMVDDEARATGPGPDE